MPVATIEDIQSKVGQVVGSSDWIEVGQDRIGQFADATEDHQFIHVDPAAAAAAGFGGTIAHGFLSLSLLSRMAADVMLIPEGTKMAVNYGFDRVRFIAPVPAGSRIRGTFTLANVEDKGPGKLLTHHHVLVEIEDSDKTALTADWIGLLLL